MGNVDTPLPQPTPSPSGRPSHTSVTASENPIQSTAQATLDASAFPHIIRAIIAYADPATRLVLRQLNRAFQGYVDRISFEHAVVVVWWDGTVGMRAYRGPGFLYDFRHIAAGDDDSEESGDDEEGSEGDDETHAQPLPTIDTGHTPQLTSALELPPHVIDLLKHVKTLDVVGHFDLRPPFPFMNPLLAILDAISHDRSPHRSGPHKLRLIPDPFGRYRWRGSTPDGSKGAHEVPKEQHSVPSVHREDIFNFALDKDMARLQVKLRSLTSFQLSFELIFSLWCHSIEKAGECESSGMDHWFSVGATHHRVHTTHWIRMLAEVGACTLVGLETVPEHYAAAPSSSGPFASPKSRLASTMRSFLDVMEKRGDAAFFLGSSSTPRPTFKHVTHKEYTALFGPQDFDHLVELAADRPLENLPHDLELPRLAGLDAW